MAERGIASYGGEFLKKAKKERVLTPAEIKRKEAVEKISAQMEQDGYRKRELTIGVLRANFLAVVVMLPFMVLAAYMFWLFSGADISYTLGNFSFIVFILAYMLLIVLHEGIHGLTWGCFARNHLHSISFGVIWKAVTPYCSCIEPLTKKQYILGSAMPTLILGFGLAAISMLTDDFLLFVLAECMILGGGGDFLVILKILMNKPGGKHAIYLDHPYECGVILFEK